MGIGMRSALVLEDGKRVRRLCMETASVAVSQLEAWWRRLSASGSVLVLAAALLWQRGLEHSQACILWPSAKPQGASQSVAKACIEQESINSTHAKYG